MKFTDNSSSLKTEFNELKDPVAFIESIKKCKISIKEARHKQEKLKRYLKKEELEIDLKKTLTNMNKLFNKRKDAIKFVDNYDSMILNSKRKAAEEKPEPKHSKQKIKCKKSPLELHE